MEKDMAEEKLILDKIARGDQQAFGVLYNSYKNKVYGYALRILDSEVLAQEIVQETFIKLWLKRENLHQISNFGGFLRTIVRNDTLNALRKIALQQKNYNLIHLSNTESDSATEASIQYNETKRILDSAIQKLPKQQQLIYNLCHVEGFKQKDVAKQLNISPLTVKSHLREAIKSLREHLNAHDGINAMAILLFILK
jgi:RNA polymerase sigma-70 factor (family 1)